MLKASTAFFLAMALLSNIPGSARADMLVDLRSGARPAPAANVAAAVRPAAGIRRGAFDSIMLKVDAEAPLARWNRLRAAMAVSGDCREAADCEVTGVPRYVIEAIAAAPLETRLSLANAWVNANIRYATDAANYGLRDYWAKPSQTAMRRSGDCEDMALLKMAILLRAGVPEHAMSLVVLRDTARNLYHAVLAVATTGGNLILDNLRADVIPDTAAASYLPLYSLSGEDAWLHGNRRGAQQQLAAMEGPAPAMAAVAPGEGL